MSSSTSNTESRKSVEVNFTGVTMIQRTVESIVAMRLTFGSFNFVSFPTAKTLRSINDLLTFLHHRVAPSHSDFERSHPLLLR